MRAALLVCLALLSSVAAAQTACEVMAVGGQIDANPTVAQQVSDRYELPIADIKAALAGLQLR